MTRWRKQALLILETWRDKNYIKAYNEEFQRFLKDYQKRFLAVVKVLHMRIAKKWDNVIAVTGEEGVGKSTFAYWLAKFLDPNFDFTRNYLYTTSTKEILEKLTNKKVKVIICDEAIKQFYKLDWASSSQKYINKVYAVARKEGKTTILCMPRFTDFNEFFRNHRIRFWFHVLARGIAVLFVPDWSPFCKDVWWMDKNQKTIEEITRYVKLTKIDIGKKINLLHRTKNFVTALIFPDMPPDDKEQYLKIIASLRYDDLNPEDEEKKKEKRREKKLKKQLASAIYYMRFQQNLTWKEISRRLGMAPETAKSLLQSDKKFSKFLEEEKAERQRVLAHRGVFKRLPFV